MSAVRRLQTAQKIPVPATTVTPTPITPARPPEIRASEMSSTPYPASGESSVWCFLVFWSMPWSLATFSRPSGLAEA